MTPKKRLFHLISLITEDTKRKIQIKSVMYTLISVKLESSAKNTHTHDQKTVDAKARNTKTISPLVFVVSVCYFSLFVMNEIAILFSLPPLFPFVFLQECSIEMLGEKESIPDAYTQGT